MKAWKRSGPIVSGAGDSGRYDVGRVDVVIWVPGSA